ncbi:DUF2946 family protein [Polynucleobacter sp.]|jgi:hypothetical protein|uniref:DUF2946 family protein n=1 Tax=Polynucleobacter sp. TaxID=2029855 RepID=UPI002733BF44|nr:DUF2946 family protein [Polynucleobacter sp.]MDP3121317.1 DUF2946 family protein [Polynucleobacter sp.]
MSRIARTWIHWLTAAAVLLGSVMPMAAHARPIISDVNKLEMAVCAPSGEQIDLRVDLGLPDSHQAQTGCAYCLIQDSYVPSIQLDLQFAEPESSSKIHTAFQAIALPIIAWMQLPSRAPPILS